MNLTTNIIIIIRINHGMSTIALHFFFFFLGGGGGGGVGGGER